MGKDRVTCLGLPPDQQQPWELAEGTRVRATTSAPSQGLQLLGHLLQFRLNGRQALQLLVLAGRST